MLAILLRVMTLLACGPLLAPPGFCVCKAGAAVCTPPQRESAGAASTPGEPSPPARCSHRHGPAKTADPTRSGEPTPAPAPHDDHVPGCPATASVERPRWVEPTAESTVTVQVAFVGVLFVPVTVGGCSPDRHALDRSYSPPLYLTQCSLVI